VLGAGEISMGFGILIDRDRSGDGGWASGDVPCGDGGRSYNALRSAGRTDKAPFLVHPKHPNLPRPRLSTSSLTSFRLFEPFSVRCVHQILPLERFDDTRNIRLRCVKSSGGCTSALTSLFGKPGLISSRSPRSRSPHSPSPAAAVPAQGRFLEWPPTDRFLPSSVGSTKGR